MSCLYGGLSAEDLKSNLGAAWGRSQFYEKGCALQPFVCGLAIPKLSESGPVDELTLRLVRSGCDRNDSASCAMLGTFQLMGRIVPENNQEAFDALMKSCDGESALGCGLLATVYMRGKGVPADPQKAADVFKKACNLGFEPACQKGGAGEVPSFDKTH